MIRNVGVLQNVWKVPELKQRILFTLAIVLVYRLGAHIPTPFIDPVKLAEWMERERQGLAGGLFNAVDLFSGRAFSNMSIMALGIMPYISVSIIIQLLTVVFPRLQKMMQEGVLGQRKINRMTRKWTIVLAAFQAFGMALYLQNASLTYMTGSFSPVFFFTTVVAMTAGTAFVMWLGERITDRGIGNGMSIIIGAGIIASYPSDIAKIVSGVMAGITPAIWLPIMLVLFALSSIAIIYTAEGSRRIPMQTAKRQVGRQTMQGGSNYLPLKINQANVIPVIFASALLTLPTFIGTYISGGEITGGFVGSFFATSSPYNGYAIFERFFGDLGYFFNILRSFNAHIVLFALMVFGISFLYTAVTFNPDDVANNLKKSGSFIPGKQPGKRTAEYLDFVMTRVTTIGATFLTIIAIMPMVLEVSYGMPFAAHSFVGGTGLIIVIGVLLDTMRQIESQLMMRHYEGHAQRRTATPRWR